MKKYEVGQTVYSSAGHAAEYVSATHDGHIVRPLMECHEDDGTPSSWPSSPEVWQAIFFEPPVEKYSDELKALHEKISAAQDKLRETKEIERATIAAHEDRLRKFKKYDQLKYVEDFLDGKISHYAYIDDYGSGAKVMTVQDAFYGEHKYDRKLRLLCLYGDLSNHTVDWHLHRYSDSSGDFRSGFYWPCTSDEAAKEALRIELTKRIAKEAKEVTYHVVGLVKSARQYDVPVPESLELHVQKLEKEGQDRLIANAEKELARAMETLNSLKAMK